MRTYEEILESMKARLTIPASKAEGSFVGDVLGAAAQELAGIYSMELEGILDSAFVSTASGEALTNICANYGIDRVPASKATAQVTITGTAGTALEGVLALADGLVFEVETGAIPAGGVITLTATAAETGSAYNVAAGEIGAFLYDYEGLSTITNAAPATGGREAEEDETLRARTLKKMRSASSGGSLKDYEAWAASVAGVSHALAQASAPNVTVYIVGEGLTAASASLVNTVKNYIEGLRPVGAVVSVSAASAVNIAVSVTANIGDAPAAEVKAAMEARIKAYFEEIALTGTAVSYIRMAELLFVEGVQDITAYTLNSGTSSVAVGSTAFPKLAEVVLNA